MPIDSPLSERQWKSSLPATRGTLGYRARPRTACKRGLRGPLGDTIKGLLPGGPRNTGIKTLNNEGTWGNSKQRRQDTREESRKAQASGRASVTQGCNCQSERRPSWEG